MSYAVPGRSGWAGQLSFPEGMGDGQSVSLEYIVVDHDYVETIGLEVIAGRDFDRDRPADAQQAVIVNEAAVAAAGWPTADEAIGRSYTSPGSGKPDGVVIGVVRDHHHHGLRASIGPVMYGIDPWALGFVSLRVAPGSATDVVAHIEDTWEAFFPGFPFSHAFLDESFAAQYAQERRLARIFGTFAGLAILLACLGLFALTSFTVRQRTKEVGVRKVLGATVAGIVTLLARDFVWLVLLGFALAAPLAYWGMSRWLQDFAYHASLGPGVFVLAASGALLIAVATVAYHAIRGATADPVRSLRAE
jgi:putative ABC transport system permease protein